MTIQAKKLFTLLGFALPLSTCALAVAETKVGYVDLQRALQEVNDARSAKTRLQALVDEKKKRFEREQADLLKEKDAYEKQMGVMTADAKVGILYAPAYLDITNELVRLYNDQKAAKGKGDLKPTRVAEPKAGSGKKK